MVKINRRASYKYLKTVAETVCYRTFTPHCRLCVCVIWLGPGFQQIVDQLKRLAPRLLPALPEIQPEKPHGQGDPRIPISSKAELLRAAYRHF